MINFLANTMFFIIKPIFSLILLKKKYPKDAIARKYMQIPEDIIFTKQDNLIMFHAVSVGEINAIENLVKKTKSMYPSKKILITTGTHTGQDLAKKKFKDIVDYITYFPVDFPCIINKFLDKFNPETVFIAETEIWPFFARACKKRGIALNIINGRISDRTFGSYKTFKYIFKYFLNFYSGIYTQSDDDNKKFLQLGSNPAITKIMNNLKFDIVKPNVNYVIDTAISPVLLAGSTHKGEDEIVLYIYRKLKENIFNLKLIIAPRHITRTEEVRALVESFGFKYDLRSNGINTLENIDVIILDTLGELSQMYYYADIAFIGGSFNKTGGHNPLEAIVFNKPVISGPSIHNFKDIYDIIKKANAGFVVEDKFEFYKIASKLLQDKSFYNSTVENCNQVFNKQQGALNFVLDLIKN